MTTASGPVNFADSESLVEIIARVAVAAMIVEAELKPKPGLVDPRGVSAHDDMSVDTLIRSAQALEPAFVTLAKVSSGRRPDFRLRAEIGEVGRTGEQQMLAATNGINTHRGALWTLGLLVCGAINADKSDEIVSYAAGLAALPDLALPAPPAPSHGEMVRLRYYVGGAKKEAQNGFPHVRLAVGVLRQARADGMALMHARLTALIVLIAHLDDTCLLHRGGPSGLAAMKQAAQLVLDEGGPSTTRGRIALAEMDYLARRRRLSPGGSGDLLAAAMFLEEITRGSWKRSPAPDVLASFSFLQRRSDENA